MNCKQNERINQVNETTLVVGVDIAKSIHYARGFDLRGIELSKKAIKFSSDAIGFKEFMQWVKWLANKNGKEKIIVGIEPTGHYWYTFAQMLKKEEILLVQVNPYHVKKAKELDDGTPSKNDKKDPKTIAMLVKDGRYQIPYIPQGIYAELRKAYDIREDLLKTRNRLKNKTIRWLDIYFPEFGSVFKKWDGKAALITLEKFPVPYMILKLTKEEIVIEWRKEAKRGVGIKRAILLLETAIESVGIKNGLEMAKYEITGHLEDYKRCCNKIKEIENKMKQICEEIPRINNVLSIKGVGIITVAGFFAEVGDISRFENPKQIIKLAGLNIVSNSSGKHKGKGRISKRGRARLRAILFKSMLPIVANNEAFEQLHRYNTIYKEKPLKKMQSIIALCNKLIKIIYRLVVNDEIFDPEKMLLDIHRGIKEKVA